MNKYVDLNNFLYDDLSSYLNANASKIIDSKELLKNKIRLIIIDMNTGSEIAYFEDVQPLYLYPLSILNYCHSLTSKKETTKPTVKIDIIRLDLCTDYINMIESFDLKYFKSIEIDIIQEYNNIYLKKILEIFVYARTNNIKTTLNIKSFDLEKRILKKICEQADYIKIFLPNTISEEEFNFFLKKINIISNIKKESSTILIKTYLNEKSSNMYFRALEKFSEMKIDIFQVSKELIPIELKKNIKTTKMLQTTIKNLEKTFNSMERTKFISVKDISTLYYPRFKLDERNSKKCYAKEMKPCVYNEYIIPCKVGKILKNIEKNYTYKIEKNYVNVNMNNFDLHCDDCASIFENDILFKIKEVLLKSGLNDLGFLLEMGDDNDNDNR